MMDALEQFKEALRSRNIEPPDDLIADGKTHYCDDKDKPKKKNACYVLHLDGIPAGGFNNYRDGKGWQNWHADPDPNRQPLTPEQKQAYQRKIELQRQEREVDKEKLHLERAAIALSIYKAATPCTQHPYLERKGIEAHGIRCIADDRVRAIEPLFSQDLKGDLLVVPMFDAKGAIKSLQFIAGNGVKRFLAGAQTSGCYFPIGKPADTLCIAEGFATGASIHEATGNAVAIAFGCTNLMDVAVGLSAKFPDITLVICADDDYLTSDNPGLTKGSQAAQAVNGSMVQPEFGDFRPKGATDFNDMHAEFGLEAVKECIERQAATWKGAYKPEPKQEAPSVSPPSPPPKAPSRYPLPQPPIPQVGQDRKPDVFIIAGKSDAMHLQAVHALQQSGLVYSFGELLARVVSSEDGPLKIETYIPDSICSEVNRNAKIWRYNAKGDQLPADFKLADAKAIIANKALYKFPKLVGVISSPYFDFKTGKIFANQGFDPDRGLYLDLRGANFSIEKIPERPGYEEALMALSKFDELIGEYPFVVTGEDGASLNKSVAIAAILTAIQRPLLPTSPLFAFSATRAGTGKSKLADVVSIIGTGSKARMLKHKHDENEFEKLIETNLLAHSLVNCIDNVNGSLSSALMCLVLTQEKISFRVLGVHQEAHVPTNTLWLATGNNIQFMEDLRRRVLISMIDPGMERPDARVFAFDPVQRAFERRPEYVRAALTILKAYYCAGCPSQGATTYGSFEMWSDQIRSALLWCGEPDPLLTREQVDEGDPRENAMRALINHLFALGTDESWDSTKLINRSMQDEPLKQILEELSAGRDGRVTSVRLGMALSRHVGKVFNLTHKEQPIKVRFTKSLYNGIAKYSVVKLT